MIILDGKVFAKNIKNMLKTDVNMKKDDAENPPLLGIILVGNDPASLSYVRSKEVEGRIVGIDSNIITLPNDVKQESLMAHISNFNSSPYISGILIQLPLPKHINTQAIIEAISPEKDVDGFHPVNIGRIAAGIDGAISPCTPAGIIKLLKFNRVDMAGKHVVILGRSNIVGKPLAQLFLRENATVTICHSKTPKHKLSDIIDGCDILVSAVGKPFMITDEFDLSEVVVVDVGMNRIDRKDAPGWLIDMKEEDFNRKEYTLVGDVDPRLFVEAAPLAMTPVPGGVGPVTIAMLLYNTYTCWKNINNINKENHNG